MKPTVVEQLQRLNLQFYQTFAAPFSATRQRIQPGVQRVIGDLPAALSVLDIGCGNGNLWQALRRQGHRGAYTGVDFSPELLRQAERLAAERSAANPPRFILADLSREDWGAEIPGGPFERVFAFAVLHHLPGADLRRRTLRQIRELLAPQGRLVFSVWQFRSSPRLAKRILDWSAIGLDAADVEPGDALLDWRSGGLGLRYAHQFDEPELQGLADSTGFEIESRFYSDGKQGNLGLYQTWKPKR